MTKAATIHLQLLITVEQFSEIIIPYIPILDAKIAALVALPRIDFELQFAALENSPNHEIYSGMCQSLIRESHPGSQLVPRPHRKK
jgi:hypothetical protein